MRTLAATVAVTVALSALLCCDKDAAKAGADGAPTASASATPTVKPPTAAPPPPRAPAIVVDDHSATIDGTTLTGPFASWQHEATRILLDKPLVAGESVVVNVARDTKTPRVFAMIAAIKDAKAKSIKVRTAMRDQTSGELELTLHPTSVPECSVVAMIEPNSAVALWSKSGGAIQRIARGMAGPDLSMSTPALQKRAEGCDSPIWFLTAAESVSWGLTFDLAMRAKGSPDAGTSFRPTRTALLLSTPVPGRPVKEE